jgi:hypothetical protein
MQEVATGELPVGEAARTPVPLQQLVLSSEEEEDTPEQPDDAEFGAQDDELALLIKQVEARGMCVTVQPKACLSI